MESPDISKAYHFKKHCSEKHGQNYLQWEKGLNGNRQKEVPRLRKLELEKLGVLTCEQMKAEEF